MCGLYIVMTVLSEQESQHVIKISPYQQCEKQYHSYNLSILKELVARLAASDDFVKQEQYVSAIQSRNRKYVHERKNNRKECGHLPETLPVPHFREYASDSTEATYALGSFFSKYILHIVYVAFQSIDTQFYTGRERSEKAVILNSHLII